MSLAGVTGRAVTWADRLVPEVHDDLVVRTPDVEDQGLELVRALLDRGIRPRAWLVDDPSQPHPEVPGVAVVRARSRVGLAHYWRSRVVVHTHGAYGAIAGSSSKVFVNLWHGMPVKRLPPSAVGRNQTHLGIATAPIHAEHLAETWDLGPERFAITGLPRNDLLVSGPRSRPEAVAALAGDRPLVMWLPTFRRSVAGEIRVDGLDRGTRTQLDGANPEVIDRLFGEIGVFGVVKLHPMAPDPGRQELANVVLWSDTHMREAGFRLYELLAHADVLLTDHSSVWIDFLLTGRPIVFTISDLDEYQQTRGYYSFDVDPLLPGPISEDIEALRSVLPRVLTDPDPWRDDRRRALEVHHRHRDAGSAARVADLIEAVLGGKDPELVLAEARRAG